MGEERRQLENDAVHRRNQVGELARIYARESRFRSICFRDRRAVLSCAHRSRVVLCAIRI